MHNQGVLPTVSDDGKARVSVHLVCKSLEFTAMQNGATSAKAIYSPALNYAGDHIGYDYRVRFTVPRNNHLLTQTLYDL